MVIKEKVERYGVEKLVRYEQISFLTGIKEDVLKEYTTLGQIFSNIDIIKCTELQKNKLRAIFDICKEKGREDLNKYKITNPWDIYRYYMDNLRYLKQEVFKVILLNSKNEVIKDCEISKGTINSSLVHPREVFREAILNSTNKIIVMHNHPSGNVEPSQADKVLTNKLKKSGEIIGIEVLDHIIIGDGVYYSFKENMML